MTPSLKNTGRSETILTNMGEGVLLVNGASEMTYANPRAISMLELPDAYIGKALIEINRIPELQALLKKAEQTESIAFAEIQLGNLREQKKKNRKRRSRLFPFLRVKSTLSLSMMSRRNGN